MREKSKRLLLKGGRLVDPLERIDGLCDILVIDGKIAEVKEKIAVDENAVKVIDVSGLVVLPGLIDMHTHLREPGYEHKETIRTGAYAAAAGGFTAVACMANTNPVNDNRSITEFILRRAEEADSVRIYPISALSLKQEGKNLVEFWDQKEAGAVAISDDGRPVMDSALMRRALEYAGSLGMTVISHCEDSYLSAGGVINEGCVSVETGLRGVPSVAEDIMVAREVMLSEYTDSPVHIAHVSTAQAVRIIREAKARGIKVTAETAPHYFTLTEEALREFDVNAKVNPPLRESRDMEVIKEGLRDGTIDVIASDHAPHAITDKELEFEYAASGISGLETSLALSLQLVFSGILSLADLVRRMSVAPAAILGIPGGTLKVGAPADITVIDLDRKWKVEVQNFRSKGKNNPFQGWELKGKAVLTVVGGKIVFQEL